MENGERIDVNSSALLTFSLLRIPFSLFHFKLIHPLDCSTCTELCLHHYESGEIS